MIDSIQITPAAGPLAASIRPPGSKSITNRALVCAALAQGRSVLEGALDCDDTRVMIDGLRRLGLAVEHDPGRATIKIDGCGGRPPARQAELYVGNSGTTVRFLTALATLGRGSFRLEGTPRMRERPIGHLLDALAELGTDVRCESPGRCPPVEVRAAGLPGGRANVAGDISSQYLSGLLMAAPCAAGPVELAVSGELVSKPYIEMTLAVMQAFGVEVQAHQLSRFVVGAPTAYKCRPYAVEPDASAASYFFAAAAVAGGRVTVQGLSRRSLQGDVGFCECLARMGCEVEYADDSITVQGRPLRGIEVDMNAISDTVQTLGAVAIFAEGATNIANVGHIRHKETDRIAALGAELRKLGAAVDEREDGLRITPGPLHAAQIDTYDDHRMAMSLAVAGLAVPGVTIRDPGCTAKTYPAFFEDLARVAAGQ